MYDSEDYSAKELHEFVTQMEEMRLNSMRARATKNDFAQYYNVKALIETFSSLQYWLQELQEAIQWYGDQPRRWAQALLANRNAMIFAFDLVDLTPLWVITRIFVITTHEKIVYDTYVKPEKAILEKICKGKRVSVRDFEVALLAKMSKTAGERVQNFHNIPSLVEAWPPLRKIIINAKDPGPSVVFDPKIVSYDLIVHGKEIIRGHAYYYPQLAEDANWIHLRWLEDFIDEAKFYFGDSSLGNDERTLAQFCKRIGYAFPPQLEQTAEDRAIAQLRLIQAMAQGIGAQDLFAEEEE